MCVYVNIRCSRPGLRRGDELGIVDRRGGGCPKGAGMASSRFLRCFRVIAVVGVLAVIPALTACKKEEKAAAPDIRPVRTVTVEPKQAGDTLSLTGEIQPRYQADIGFRVDGKILARPVDVGASVKT